MTERETEYGPINTVIQQNGYFPRACQELIGKLDPFYSLRARDGLTTAMGQCIGTPRGRQMQIYRLLTNTLGGRALGNFRQMPLDDIGWIHPSP